MSEFNYRYNFTIPKRKGVYGFDGFINVELYQTRDSEDVSNLYYVVGPHTKCEMIKAHDKVLLPKMNEVISETVAAYRFKAGQFIPWKIFIDLCKEYNVKINRQLIEQCEETIRFVSLTDVITIRNGKYKNIWVSIDELKFSLRNLGAK